MVNNIKKQVNYLIKITDNIGVIEHCISDHPNYVEGYSVDDNARSLQVCLRFLNQFPELKKVLPVYFNFLKSAIKDGVVYNDLNSDLTWQKNFKINGEHSGRTLAALGEVIGSGLEISSEAKTLFSQIYSRLVINPPSYCRVFAQIILGLKYYQSNDINIWADLLVEKYLKEKTDHWKWFEPIITYDIGRLPLALLTAYDITKNNLYKSTALESLDFLTKETFDQKLGCFVFPGNRGWFTKSGHRHHFDQQPLEAGSITEAYSLAYKITNDKNYQNLATKAFSWYEGNNISKFKMVNSLTGGIYDGFSRQEININQGSESVLSYLLGFYSIVNSKPNGEITLSS